MLSQITETYSGRIYAGGTLKILQKELEFPCHFHVVMYKMYFTGNLKYNQECFVWLLTVYQVYGRKTTLGYCAKY